MNDAHERWREELPAYLLGALEPSEVSELGRHLDECDRCRTELRWLTPALDALPETVERLEPTPRLRARLMAEVREDAGVEPEAAVERRGLLSRLHDAFTGPHWRPIAAGFAVLLVAVAVVGFEIGNSGSGGGGGNPGITVEAEEESGVIAAVSMEGTKHGRIELTNVPELPPNRVLEAWVEREGVIEAVPTLFVPDGKGRATTNLGDMRGVHTVMVTTEPPGGSEAPTSTPIAAVKLPRA